MQILLKQHFALVDLGGRIILEQLRVGERRELLERGLSEQAAHARVEREHVRVHLLDHPRLALAWLHLDVEREYVLATVVGTDVRGGHADPRDGELDGHQERWVAA